MRVRGEKDSSSLLRGACEHRRLTKVRPVKVLEHVELLNATLELVQAS